MSITDYGTYLEKLNNIQIGIDNIIASLSKLSDELANEMYDSFYDAILNEDDNAIKNRNERYNYYVDSLEEVCLNLISTTIKTIKNKENK